MEKLGDEVKADVRQQESKKKKKNAAHPLETTVAITALVPECHQSKLFYDLVYQIV